MIISKGITPPASEDFLTTKLSCGGKKITPDKTWDKFRAHFQYDHHYILRIVTNSVQCG